MILHKSERRELWDRSTRTTKGSTPMIWELALFGIGVIVFLPVLAVAIYAWFNFVFNAWDRRKR